VKVREFERYPQAEALQTVFGRFYYSYKPDSCAGNYWTSDIFHLEYHYVTPIGRMSGNHCEEPYDVKLYLLHGEAQELRETLPYPGEQDSDKRKFIDRSWYDHYKRVFPDTLTVNQFVKFFNHPIAKDYDVEQYKSKYWTYMTDKGKFWKNKKLLVGDTLKRLPVWGYPLSHTALNDTIKRVTLLEETNSGYQIAVYTLDKYYNVIASESLTRAEGDQGDQYKSVGYFINDTTYLKTEIITVLDSVGSPSTHYLIFHGNGSIARR
jgi:hypothetical protein